MVIDLGSVLLYVGAISAPILLIINVASFMIKLLEKAREDFRQKTEELRKERDDARNQRDDALKARSEMRTDLEAARRRVTDCETELYELRRLRRQSPGDADND